MKNDKLFVLISTYNNRIEMVEHIVQEPTENISYIISHQVIDLLNIQAQQIVETLKKREDVKYLSMNSMGLAKNRNNTLKYIDPSSICMILDDDITLCKDSLKKVLESFHSRPEVDFITFKMLDERHQAYKYYPSQTKQHTWKSLTSVSSVEMAFRSDIILKYQIKFDERFGIGTDMFPSGEDYIFAMDLHRKNINMWYVPISTVIHPSISTGYKMSKKGFFAKGAVFARVFGIKSYIIDFLFAIKHYNEYHLEFSFFESLLSMWKGSYSFMKSNKL